MAFFSKPVDSDASSEDPFTSAREAMVRTQIESRGIKDPGVLRALLKVKRHLFVPNDIAHLSYRDEPLPIGFGQTISQPYIVALMTQLCQISPSDKVLEIGSGSGYQTAILGELAKEVYSIEIIDSLSSGARLRLKNLGYKNIKIRTGDGYLGWPEVEPFDVIIITAAPAEIPQELIRQLKIGGRMVVPVGSVTQDLLVITKKDDGSLDKKSVIPVRFVPMVKTKP